MNPSSERIPTPDISMPAGTGEAMPQAAGLAHEQQRSGAEQQPANPGMQQPPYLAPLPPLPPQEQSSAKPAPVWSANPAAQSTTAPDEQSIEKECIDKAKKIVEQTKSDPFTQSRELSKVKAEFLKRRYGKDIKLSEGS